MTDNDPYQHDDPFNDSDAPGDRPHPSDAEMHDHGDGYDLSEPVDDVYPQSLSEPPKPPRPQGPITATEIRCTICGYNLTGVSIGSNCPECGREVNLSMTAASAGPPSGKAITSMVLGICSIISCCCPGPLLAIIGLIFGIIALNEVGPTPSSARGMALAGVWCSGVGLVLAIGYWMLAIIG